MAFYLVKEKKFKLRSKDREMKNRVCYSTFRVPALIEPIENGSLCDKDCARLIQLLEDAKPAKCLPGVSETEVGEHVENPKALLNWNLTITMAITCGNSSKRDSVTVTGVGEETILKRLVSFLDKYGLKLKIMVNFHTLTYIKEDDAQQQTANFSIYGETDIDKLRSQIEADLNFSKNWSRYDWNPINNCLFKGAITISCVLYSTTSYLNFLLLQVNKTILNEEMNCDAVIIAKDNVSVKCHKAFLSAQSSVFQTMFSGENYEESKTSTVEMPDMTEDGVKAFMEYIYLLANDKAEANCGIAFELLQAGHKYDVPSLEESMKSILLNKPDDWYQVDVSMKLFLFARNLPQGEELKKKAIKLLKRNYSTLKTSPTYKQLFMGDDRDALMELCEYAFSI